MEKLLLLDLLENFVRPCTDPAVPGQLASRLRRVGQERPGHPDNETPDHALRGVLQLIQTVGSLVDGVVGPVWGVLPLLGP